MRESDEGDKNKIILSLSPKLLDVCIEFAFKLGIFALFVNRREIVILGLASVYLWNPNYCRS